MPQVDNVKLDLKTSGDISSEANLLFDKIDLELNRPNITREDMERGYYVGKKSDKKYGTPDSWRWAKEEGGKWMNEEIARRKVYIQERSLCRKTGGKYFLSCMDTEVKDCEYVPETYCLCRESSKWDDHHGCLQADGEGGFIFISGEELKRGWYLGGVSDKKKNTPLPWVWKDVGPQSRWQNPYLNL